MAGTIDEVLKGVRTALLILLVVLEFYFTVLYDSSKSWISIEAIEKEWLRIDCCFPVSKDKDLFCYRIMTDSSTSRFLLVPELTF